MCVRQLSVVVAYLGVLVRAIFFGYVYVGMYIGRGHAQSVFYARERGIRFFVFGVDRTACACVDAYTHTRPLASLNDL